LDPAIKGPEGARRRQEAKTSVKVQGKNNGDKSLEYPEQEETRMEPVRKRGDLSITIRRLGIFVAMAIVLTTASVVAGAQQSTFTKWVTTAPAMAGVVGGACGTGSYVGEILKYTEGPTTVIEALYHFNGSKHVFSALVHVEQTGMKAVIDGVVTEGWMKGNPVRGEYTQITTKQSPNGTAFQGTLDIMPAAVATN
jgi:hypothetical protein